MLVKSDGDLLYLKGRKISDICFENVYVLDSLGELDELFRSGLVAYHGEYYIAGICALVAQCLMRNVAT